MSRDNTRQGYKNLGTRGGPSNRRIGFRSRSQMKRDVQKDNADAEEFVAALAQKAQISTPEQVKKRNPTKETPNLSLPQIKLDHYTSEWIETDRKNIQVELREDFEDQLMIEHSKAIAYSTDALQYEDPQNVATMLLAFYGYSYCNVAYRLILTVPSSARSSVADFLREIRDAEQPSQTPAFAEMLSHLGKSDIPNYGRLRIDYPLLSARRRIARAVWILRETLPFSDEFQLNHGAQYAPLEHFRLLIWNDQDSMDYVREKASEYIRNELKIVRCLDDIGAAQRANYPNNRDDLRFCYPYIDVSTTNPNGTRRFLTPDEILEYWRYMRIYDPNQVQRFMACLIMLSTSFDYFYKGNKRLVNDNNRWRDHELNQAFPFLNSTADQITAFMGFSRLNNVMDERRLRFNYHVIVNVFKASFKPRLARIFDFVSVSKEEFGDESQAITIADDQVYSNPLLHSQFQFRNRQNIAAGGIFRYAFKVRHHLAEEMIMKRTRSSMIAEIVSKFAKKNA